MKTKHSNITKKQFKNAIENAFIYVAKGGKELDFNNLRLVSCDRSDMLNDDEFEFCFQEKTEYDLLSSDSVVKIFVKINDEKGSRKNTGKEKRRDY